MTTLFVDVSPVRNLFGLAVGAVSVTLLIGRANMAKEPSKRGAIRRTKAEAEVHLSSIAAEASAPTEANIREIRTRIEDVFNALGTEELQGTVIPVGSKNNAKEAAEFVIADLLSKLSSDRLKSAKEAAEKAGVFGDPSSYVSGDTVMVFNDPNFSINVKKGKPTKMIGKEEVQAALVKHLGKKADEVLEECFKPRNATTQIIVSMK